MGLGVLACAACAATGGTADHKPTPAVFYTVTAEIALVRGEPRIAALQYAAAAANESDPDLLQRATQVAAESLQPTLAAGLAARWITIDPKSLGARRAAARAALALHRINESANHYRIVLMSSSIGTDAEFAQLETELGSDENIFGARQVADRLASFFPSSAPARRVQGVTALRTDDPAAAVQSFSTGLELKGAGATSDGSARREMTQSWLRARIMAGDSEAPLAQAKDQLEGEDTTVNRLDYAVLLMAAQRNAAATEQLEILARNPDSAAVALRLLGLLEFQEGHLEAAGRRFTDLLATGRYLDDAFYYLGLIADRNGDTERAMRLYSQVRGGDNTVPALLRATALLRAHGAAPAAEELLDRLIQEEPQRAPQILTARARLYADSGDFTRAVAVLNRGIAEYPDNVDLRYAMASIFEAQGRVGAALRELKALLKSRPDDPAAQNALGYTLADHSKELARARALIERACLAAPKNAAILDSLGWVLFRQGHGAQALSYLTAAYADDRGGDIAAHLGEVLWSLGRSADAEHIWSEASVLDGDNRLLRATRQRLHKSN